MIRKLATNDSFNHQNLKFLPKVGDEVEEVMGYAELCDVIQEQVNDEMDNPDKYWTFKDTLAHKGPLKPQDPEWKGSLYNVHVQ